MREIWACKGYTRCVEMCRRKGIPNGARISQFRVLDTMNGETWDILGTQLYVVLPL